MSKNALIWIIAILVVVLAIMGGFLASALRPAQSVVVIPQAPRSNGVEAPQVSVNSQSKILTDNIEEAVENLRLMPHAVPDDKDYDYAQVGAFVYLVHQCSKGDIAGICPQMERASKSTKNRYAYDNDGKIVGYAFDWSKMPNVENDYMGVENPCTLEDGDEFLIETMRALGLKNKNMMNCKEGTSHAVVGNWTYFAKIEALSWDDAPQFDPSLE